MAAARRRRLPTQVYWFRRGLVLVVAAALVVGIAHLVGGTGEDTVATDRAATAGARTASESAPLPQYGPLEAAKVKRRQVRNAAPAEPSGPCVPEDVAAVPSVPSPDAVDAAEAGATEQPMEGAAPPRPPEAGGPVTIDLALQGTQPACTLEVGPDSIAVKITTEGDEPFWSSQDCPGQLPRETVVVRSAEPTLVSMTWNARDSEVGCRTQSQWALPGFYRVHATVQGSTPSDVPFELVRPSVVYVTETPKPRPGRGQGSPDASPSAPTASPTG